MNMAEYKVDEFYRLYRKSISSYYNMDIYFNSESFFTLLKHHIDLYFKKTYHLKQYEMADPNMYYDIENFRKKTLTFIKEQELTEDDLTDDTFLLFKLQML